MAFGGGNSGSRPGGACYLRGTRVLTVTGALAIEALSIGDIVVTVSGAHRPVRWLGHRVVDVSRHPDPVKYWPILVAAGAFGDGVPARDLFVSPEHALPHDGVLIPAYLLANGATIRQVERSAAEYWHLELDSHDLVLAENMPAETYLDCGNRAFFVECDSHTALHPDFQPYQETDSCLPRVSSGDRFVQAKAALLDRARALGHVTTSSDDLHILADGSRIEPTYVGENRAVFLLPPNRSDISLGSRTFVPAHCDPASTDTRALGVCIRRLMIDGDDLDLADDALCAAGWHACEPGTRRWTKGVTTLPPHSRLILVDLAGRGTYWAERTDNLIRLAG